MKRSRCESYESLPVMTPLIASAATVWPPTSMTGRQRIHFHLANRSAARALAFAASSCRFLGAPLVSSDPSSCAEILAMSLTAELKAASFIFDGLLNPVIFRTNWTDAARISSSVAGGSKLNSVLMFRHIQHRPPKSEPTHTHTKEF